MFKHLLVHFIEHWFAPKGIHPALPVSEMHIEFLAPLAVIKSRVFVIGYYLLNIFSGMAVQCAVAAYDFIALIEYLTGIFSFIPLIRHRLSLPCSRLSKH